MMRSVFFSMYGANEAERPPLAACSSIVLTDGGNKSVALRILSMAAKGQDMTIQVGALPVRRKADGSIEILLVTARQKNRWLIPKGGRSGRLTDDDAAAREALEEAGVEGKIKKRPVGDYRHLRADGRKGPRIIVFKMKVRRDASNWKEKNERKRRWLSPAAAASLVKEKTLRKIILDI